MAKKRAVRYSAATTNFICKKIEEGMLLKHICQNFPEKAPDESTVYKWRKKHAEFKDKFDKAYETLLYRCMEEFMELKNLSIPTPTEIDIKYGLDGDKTLIKAYLGAEQKNVDKRKDILKTILTHIFPKKSSDMSEKVQVDHEHKGGVQFVLQDWSKPKAIEKGREIDVDPKDK